MSAGTTAVLPLLAAVLAAPPEPADTVDQVPPRASSYVLFDQLELWDAEPGTAFG